MSKMKNFTVTLFREKNDNAMENRHDKGMQLRAERAHTIEDVVGKYSNLLSNPNYVFAKAHSCTSWSLIPARSVLFATVNESVY
jgi:hypothetical protein